MLSHSLKVRSLIGFDCNGALLLGKHPCLVSCLQSLRCRSVSWGQGRKSSAVSKSLYLRNGLIDTNSLSGMLQATGKDFVALLDWFSFLSASASNLQPIKSF